MEQFRVNYEPCRVLRTVHLGLLKIIDFLAAILNFSVNEKIKFILKTVSDGSILGKLFTYRVQGSTPVGPLTNYDFSEIWLPSFIFMEEKKMWFIWKTVRERTVTSVLFESHK